jgi:isopenicillin N synthase-like dioxygenase
MNGVCSMQRVLDRRLVSCAFREAEALFALPDAQKLACRAECDGIGYTPPGVEGVRDLPKDQFRSFWDLARPGSNRFPEGCDSSALEQLFTVVERMAADVFGSCLPEQVSIVEGGPHGLRASYFQARAARQIDMPCHRDMGFLTVFIGGSRPGLEGKHGDVWVPVVNDLGDIVVGVGTAMGLYDSGRSAFEHRVVSTGRERVSLTFSLNPRSDAVLPNGETAGARLQRIVHSIRGDGVA